jgi:extracellular elastinolytic metalloproteinase
MSHAKRSRLIGLSAALVALTLVPTPMLAADTESEAEAGPVAIARSHVADNAASLGVGTADVSDLRVTSVLRSAHNGVTHVNMNQRFDGLEVFGGQTTVNISSGEVLFVGGRLVEGLADATGRLEIDAIDAVESAASALDLEDPANLRVISESDGPARRTVVSGGGVSDAPIPARLGWQPTKGGLRLAWQLVIDDVSDQHLWNATVDAQTSDLLAKDDWVDQDSMAGLVSALARPSVLAQGASLASPEDPVEDGSNYQVFEVPKESPNDGERTLVTNPADAEFSPFGWHDTDGTAGADFTVTRGNNAHAYTDRDNDGDPDPGSDPDGGAGLSFDFPLDLSEHPQTYFDSSVTNLFYWNNVIHDVMAGYGFTEPFGNFQVTNYSGTGAGGDDVRAEAADGGGQNNANFLTPAMDGGRPRMQMFLWPGNQFGRPNAVTVNAGSAAGTYQAEYARFTPAPTGTGLAGDIVLVNDGVATGPVGTVNDGCEPYALPAGSIALVDRAAAPPPPPPPLPPFPPVCSFRQQVDNAETAGAVALVVANNVAGNPVVMSGSMEPAPVGIPAVMVSQDDGTAIKGGLPATGSVHRNTARPPMRDGDLESGIIIHEYGHGISNRLTGGIKPSNCLSGAEQMGEGWSDYYAIAMLLDPALDDPEQPRGMGPYALFQDSRHGAGIRPRPYTRDMEIQPFTYDRIKTNSWITGQSLAIPHGIGHTWAATLWDTTWNLIDRHGFNPNIYEPWNTGGNNLALQLVTDGLKFQGCFPGFIDGRNGILAAEQALTGGENACILWSSFARRGLGFSATQGTSANRDDNTEAFDVPPACNAPGTGFAPPVANPPAVNTFVAGTTVPLRFNIGGNRGVDPLASNSPASQQIDCATGLPVQFAITTPTASSNNKLTYNATTQHYQYNWATLGDWAGTCRQVIITLDDGTQLRARFEFTA